MSDALISVVSSLSPLLVRATNQNRLTILIYHGVLPTFDYLRPDEPTAEQFEWQMRLLRKHFNPLPLKEAIHRMVQGTLPAKAVCVTFDDGYANNESIALPILQKWRVPATVFVATDYLDGGRMWNDTIIETIRLLDPQTLDLSFIGLDPVPLANQTDRLNASRLIIKAIKHASTKERQAATQTLASMVNGLPDDLMLDHSQLIHLHQQGITIGAHTLSHPILTSLEPARAQQEIEGSKALLEERIDHDVDLFAYPNGKPGVDYDLSHTEMVKKAGFDACVSTQWGAASTDSDVWQLPRFTPWDKDPLKFTARLLMNYRHPQ